MNFKPHCEVNRRHCLRNEPTDSVAQSKRSSPLPFISIDQSHFNELILSSTLCPHFSLNYVHLYSHIKSFHPWTPAPLTVACKTPAPLTVAHKSSSHFIHRKVVFPTLNLFSELISKCFRLIWSPPPISNHSFDYPRHTQLVSYPIKHWNNFILIYHYY